MQTAANLLASSAPAPAAEAELRSKAAMPCAFVPPAVSHPLPIFPTDTIAAATEVSLVVDTRDTRGSGVGRAAFFALLCAGPGLSGRVIERQLPVGDALLVARVTAAGSAALANSPAPGTELVLDFLLERKTADDLVASIKAARLLEQAYFMAASGRPSMVLVVEGDVNGAIAGDAQLGDRVRTYLAELSTTGGFMVKYTADVGETVAYCSSLLRYRGQRLVSAAGLSGWLSSASGENAAMMPTVAAASGAHTFETWAHEMHEMRSSTTLQQLWALQLLLLPGVGNARVDSIITAFETPAALALAYRSVSSEMEAEQLLARLPAPPGARP
eukprot:TRINITY_DN1060_c0_g1_i4.p2 TRINITY_DN1060_c0_g1~~TRINITY_DN1060_c0_g1_i4.p2  ORF type:complete len:330 (-),score=77.37 TRINITY_DN1060_c0_g1_i4:230-1219(-)